tara:strand:- start:411 stop:638 length:228 start_codon:yes stop_codon:yes gene_type:complete
MKYENGFYTYLPGEEAEEWMHELSVPQVIQIIEDEVWLAGVSEPYPVDYAEAIGVIGKMVMSGDGKIIKQSNNKG